MKAWYGLCCGNYEEFDVVDLTLQNVPQDPKEWLRSKCLKYGLKLVSYYECGGIPCYGVELPGVDFKDWLPDEVEEGLSLTFGPDENILDTEFQKLEDFIKEVGWKMPAIGLCLYK